MALLSTPLTQDCEQEVIHLIEQLPEKDLPALLISDPAFQSGGFRAEAKPTVIRQRIRQVVLGSTMIPDTLRTTLARRSRAALLIRQLTLDTLIPVRHALACLLTPKALLVGLMLDPRPEIRTVASDWIATPFLPLDIALAQEQLNEHFTVLLSMLGTERSPATNHAVTPERWREQKEQLELTILELRQENRRLKGVDDRLSSTLLQLKKCTDRSTDDQRKIEALECEVRIKNSALDACQAKLAREVANRDHRTKAAIDLALASEFYGWLAQAKQIEETAQDPNSAKSILEGAERALQNQATVDRQYGNVRILEQRLSDLDAMSRRVTTALRQSIRQAPELKQIHDHLHEEIQKIRRMLDPAPATTQLEQDLIHHIHAQTETELHALIDLPERLKTLRIVDADAAQRIADEIRRRCALLDVREVPLPETVTAPKTPTSLLARALAGQIPALLLLDGHNVIFGLPARYHPTRGEAATESTKRQRLTQDVVRITASSPALRTSIVFDGPTHQEHQVSPNVRVTYSGGIGEHRADNVLLDNIRFLSEADPNMTLLLVTNDNDLRKEAHRLGAKTIPVLELGAFF